MKLLSLRAVRGNANLKNGTDIMTTVLVTGANRGLGLEFARQYAKEKTYVFACCRNPRSASELNALAKDTPGGLSLHQLDVADRDSIPKLKREIGAEAIDIVINNAGIYGPRHQDGMNMDFDGWEETLHVNTLGPLRVTQAFLPNLKAGKEKKLIAITSGMGSIGETSGGYVAYRTAKAALNMLMRNLAIELKGDGIIAVPMNPGWVKTDMGGPTAPLSPTTSVTGMRKIIAELGLEDSGRFLSHDGREIPW
jgi:NAD(P)-dependent dehydrogenase (short-subunit alcohol dehydrogenase family)